MLDSLLRHALRPEPEAREARVQGVLQRLDEQAAVPAEDRREAVVQIRRSQSPVRRWVSLAVADWMVKLALALLALVPFRIIVGFLGRRTT